MFPSRFCRCLKIATCGLALVLVGGALRFPARPAFASPGAPKEPVAQPQDSECCHAANPELGAFFRSLKRAVASRDVAATALLVEYPLRLNSTDGGITSLDNPRALETHFDEVFPPDLRDAMGHATEADVGSWVEDRVGLLHNALAAELTGHGSTHRWRVTDVYLPFTPLKAWQSLRLWQRVERGLQYACETQKHWIIIDTAAGQPRYRAWNKPHFPPDEADMEISPGKSESSSDCVAWSWTFTRGDTTYSLGVPSRCKKGGPDDAAAEVTVAIQGKAKQSWWCY